MRGRASRNRGSLLLYREVNVMVKLYPQNVKYFGQTDVDGNFFPNCLYRYREFDQTIIEEAWNQNLQTWESTDLLTGMIIHGECTLMPVDLLRAKEFSPDAFMVSI